MTSSINPQNIDANYPVAGVPNNTQGFRDNFTNIQTNFTYAANEITDLENKAVLKSALNGTTLDNNMGDQLIYSALIRDFSGSIVQNTVTSGAITLDYSSGHYQTVSTSGSITLGFTNWPASGTVGMMRVQANITNTSYTMTLPAAVTLGLTGIQGISSNVITFAATGYYEFGFVTSDGGTTITVFDLNRPLSYFTNTVNVAATTSSTSTTTGALLVAGGAGIVGNVYGGNIRTAGLISATGNITGGNIISSAAIAASSYSATANITGGNLISSGVISSSGNVRLLASTVVPAGGTTGAGLLMSNTTNLGVFFGSGAPTLSAAQGSLYLRTDGSTTGTRMYVNTTGSTTWTAVTTAA
jgi:hypothetical protein